MDMYLLVNLIAALGEMKLPKTFLMEYMVGNIKEHPTVKFNVQTKTAKRTLAPFVGRYSDGVFVPGTLFKTKEFEPAIIKPYTIANAERLLQQQFGQTIYGDYLTEEEHRSGIVGEELEELDNTITRREQWMLAKLITTGIIPIVGEGVDRAITFGEANIEDLLGEDKWNSSMSDPIKDLEDKIMEVEKETGVTIDTVFMGYEAYNTFEKHKLIQEMLMHRNAKMVTIENTKTKIPGAKYKGYFEKFNVDIYVISEWVYDEIEKKDVELYPTNMVTGLQQGFVTMHYGAVAQIPYGETTEMLFINKRVPHVWVAPGSNNKNIQLQAKPLPVPIDSRAWFTLKVL